MTKKNLSESILQKRINRFKSIKRGYYSLIILISLYVLSICAPVIFNSKAIMVKYNDDYYFPLFNSIFSNKNIEAKDLGQFEIKGKKKYGQPHYRLLKKQYQKEDKGNWVIMPLYPYDPYEEVMSEKDEQFTDMNGNGVWDRLCVTSPFSVDSAAKDFTFSDTVSVVLKSADSESFNFYKGEISGMIGESGSAIPAGKGTLIELSNKFFEDCLSDFKFSDSNGNSLSVRYLSGSDNVEENCDSEVCLFLDEGNLKYSSTEDIAKFQFLHIGEDFIDENGNGIADKYKYTNFPDSQHLLGTDNQGRDVLSRLIYGFNISITFAIVCCFLSYIIGIIIGGTLGYFGGKVDLFGLRIIEIYGSIPFLFMLMILATFIKPNVYILASMYVFLTGWIGITWYVRGEFLREKSKDYVSAAVSMGQSHWNVMFRHILPNSLTPVITFAPFAIIGYISALVSLDYLGFGLQPPTPSWGELMAQGRTNLQYWHLIVSPLFSIGATLFLITFIGEAIREAFDPKVHSRLR